MVTPRRRSAAILLIAGLFAAHALLAPQLFAKEPPIDPEPSPPDQSGQGTLTRPDGAGQIDQRMPERLEGVGLFQHLPAIDESGAVIVAVRKEPWWKAGVLDPVLTNACRLGDFAAEPYDRMIVKFDVPAPGAGALQIIPPDRRHLLIDVRRLSAPGETYYFADTGRPSCQVWVENLVKPRKLGKGGTSLAPKDPNALKNKEALIKSWPQKDPAATAPPTAQPGQ